MARLDLGHEANFNQPLCTVAHLNYYLLEGGHNVLSVAFPNISHATLRDFPSSSSPGFLSGSNRSLTHLTLMQHSPCPPGLDPAAVNFNMLVHHHFHSLSSISGSVRVLTFKMIHQEHHIFSLFDLIRTNQFPSLRILNIMAKGDTAFIKYPHLTPLSSISRPRPITIQEIVIDAAHTSWAAHNLLAGCKLPHLKSLRILNQTAPISVNSLLAVIQGTGALRILELPFQSFSVQKAIRLKKHLRYKSSLNTQLSLEILEDPTDEKKSWGALIMSCVGPRDER